jgi:hypothetical protein
MPAPSPLHGRARHPSRLPHCRLDPGTRGLGLLQRPVLRPLVLSDLLPAFRLTQGPVLARLALTVGLPFGTDPLGFQLVRRRLSGLSLWQFCSPSSSPSCRLGTRPSGGELDVVLDLV